MTEHKLNKHIVALTALFILGDAIIILPFKGQSFTVLGLAAAVVISFLFFSVSLYFCRLLEKKAIPLSEIIAPVFLLSASVYAFYSAALTLKRYITFATKILLPETPKFLVAALFILIAVYLAVKSNRVILKLSLVFVLIAVFSVLLFFLLSLKDFKAENVLIYSLPSLKDLWSETKPYFPTLALPALLVPIYTVFFVEKCRFTAPFWGLCIGLGLTSLCVLESLFLFAAPLASRLEFPLSAAVSTVTVGPLFFRLDGVVYCLFFITALIKTSTCMKLCYMILEKLINSTKKSTAQE